MNQRAEAVKHFDQALRHELRAQRKALSEYIAQLKANRRAALTKARHVCATSKERAKVRAANIRAKARDEAKLVMQAAKTSCERGKARARRHGEKEIQAALTGKRQALADERNVLRSKRKPTERKATKRRGERLDEVRQDIPRDLLPVFEAVKTTLRPQARKSLTETFLEWAEDNPEEVNALRAELSASDDSLIREALAEQRATERALRSRRVLAPNDWKVLGTSPAELEAVGLNPRDPDDVIAFLAGYTQHLKDLTRGAVPF
jgi:hypothetical protein